MKEDEEETETGRSEVKKIKQKRGHLNEGPANMTGNVTGIKVIRGNKRNRKLV